MTTPTVLKLSDLHNALDRCMRAHPPEGIERSLHPDANTLADVWARILVERIDTVPMDGLKPRVLEVYRQWSVSG